MLTDDVVSLPVIITACRYQYILFVWSTEARAALLAELEKAHLVTALPAFSSVDNLFDVVALTASVKRRADKSVMRDVLGTNKIALLYTLDGYLHSNLFFSTLADVAQCPVYPLNAPVLLHQYSQISVSYSPDATIQSGTPRDQLKIHVCNGDANVCNNIVKCTRVGALLFPDDFDPDLPDELSFPSFE